MRRVHFTRPDARLLASLALLLLAAAACYLGPRLEDFPAATTPAGASVRVARRGWTLDGELLAVRDSALLVRRERQVVLVPWRRVSYVEIRKGGAFLTDGKPPHRALRERLRLMSRFPQDMSPEVERALLATLGRDSVEVER